MTRTASFDPYRYVQTHVYPEFPALARVQSTGETSTVTVVCQVSYRIEGERLNVAAEAIPCHARPDGSPNGGDAVGQLRETLSWDVRADPKLQPGAALHLAHPEREGERLAVHLPSVFPNVFVDGAQQPMVAQQVRASSRRGLVWIVFAARVSLRVVPRQLRIEVGGASSPPPPASPPPLPSHHPAYYSSPPASPTPGESAWLRPTMPRVGRSVLPPPVPHHPHHLCATSAVLQPASSKGTATDDDPEPPPSEVEEVSELLWSDDDDPAIDRARAWTRNVPSRRRRQRREDDPVSKYAWLAAGRAVRPCRIVSDVSLGTRKALDAPAIVVRARATVVLRGVDELEAARAHLRAKASQHPAIAEALAATAGVQPGPYASEETSRQALEELYAAVDGQGVERARTERAARDAVTRNRGYASLTVLGKPHVVLRFSDDEAELVAYLPEEAAAHLPLVDTFEVRAVVAVHPRQDPKEHARRALRIAAIARVHDAAEVG